MIEVEKEKKLKELTFKGDLKIRQKVIDEMVEYWDKNEVGGCFSEFIVRDFGIFWMRRVMRN